MWGSFAEKKNRIIQIFLDIFCEWVPFHFCLSHWNSSFIGWIFLSFKNWIKSFLNVLRCPHSAVLLRIRSSHRELFLASLGIWVISIMSLFIFHALSQAHWRDITRNRESTMIYAFPSLCPLCVPRGRATLSSFCTLSLSLSSLTVERPHELKRSCLGSRYSLHSLHCFVQCD